MSYMKVQLSSSLFRDLQNAAIHPKKRHFFIFRALNKYISIIKASGVALIRYSKHYESMYKLTYCGPNQVKMENWLHNRIESSTDLTVANLYETPTIFSHTKTQFIPYNNGLLIIWHSMELDIFDDFHNVLSDCLKAISFVEENEKLYFYDIEQPFEPELSKLISNKDQDGLFELLAITRSVSNCDFVFWGDTNSKHIEVTSHLGSQDSGFGFQLPYGQGIGGYAAQNKSLLQVSDYKNCEYRYQEVSTAVDEENVRTVLALPVKDKEANTSGVLYVSNREVKPFSMKEKFILLRLGHSIEPLTKQRELNQFFPSNHYEKYIKQKKGELRNIVEHAKQITDLEVWLEDFLNGAVTIVDQKGKAYSNRITEAVQMNKQQRSTFSLERNNQKLGELIMWTNLKLPPKGWSDLIEDVISAIYIILEREKRVHHAIELERFQWISSLMNHSTDLNIQYKKGIRLGIPVDSGEVWTIYWDINEEHQLTSRNKIKLEEVVLKRTKNPLIFLGKIGFIIFDKGSPCHPDALRNELLKELAVTTWIVHSATYSSFQQLQNNLIQLQQLIERITLFDQKKFILEFNDFGLEYLLTNPSLAKDLNKFATEALRPIIEYDQKNDTQFTKTLTLSLVYQSPTEVAKKLYIHTNTVHYRVNRAKELLEMDMNKLGNDIALRLAAYTWLYNQKTI